MPLGSVASSSPAFVVSSSSASSGSLRNVMQAAANTTGASALRSGQAATTTMAQAIEAFQRSAADTCFKDSKLTNYLINTAKGSGEFKATADRLLEHATLIHSLGVTGSGVDTLNVLKDLQGMVRKFHDAPVALDTLQLNKNKKDYNALKDIGMRLDGLIDASAARPKLLENIQIHLVQSYVTAGLREGIEQRFGMLDAHGAHDVMSNGTASSAAWQALDAALGKAVRNQTHQGFGEFVRGTLAILDLKRAGAEKAPDAAPKAPDQPDSPAALVDLPKLLELLVNAKGGSSGCAPITVSPVITVNGGNMTGGAGSVLSDADVKRIATEVIEQRSAQGDISGLNAGISTKHDVATQTSSDDVVPQANQELPDAQRVNNALGNNENLADPFEGAAESESSSGSEFSYNDVLFAGNGQVRIPRAHISEASSSNLTSPTGSLASDNNHADSMPPVLQNNTIPRPPIEDVDIEQENNFLSHDRDIAAATVVADASPVESSKSVEFYRDLLSRGQVKVVMSNLPRSAPVDFMGNFVIPAKSVGSDTLQAQLLARRSNRSPGVIHPGVRLPQTGSSNSHKNFFAELASGLQINAYADPAFKIVKQQIKEGVPISELEKSPAAQALFEANSAFKLRLMALTNQLHRVNNADPAVGRNRPRIIASVGSTTGIPGSYRAIGNHGIQK